MSILNCLFRGVANLRRDKLAVPFLVSCFAGGLLLGFFWTAHADPSFAALMRRASNAPVSIFGLLAATFFPFLLSAIAVYFSKSWLLYPICFFKAFCFGTCATAVAQAFGSAGWLVQPMLLFSDCCTLPLLCLFWLRHVSGQRRLPGAEFLLVASLLLLIGCIDYRLVSPFLAELMNF